MVAIYLMFFFTFLGQNLQKTAEFSYNSLTGITSEFRLEKLMLFIWYFFTFFGRNYADGRILILQELCQEFRSEKQKSSMNQCISFLPRRQMSLVD